ncbi:MAG: SurA N-terminal domain-containing protein [Rhodospirillales bacterium]|nr:SurA N-terminal domain-containing protein [Rhodospirillales bacterium]
MLAILRRSLDTWPVRLFFLALVAAFVFWGVAARINLTGGIPPVARVAGHKIELAHVQQAYQQQLQRIQASLPQGEQPSAAIRKALAAQVVDQLITAAAVDTAIRNLGIVVPTPALQQAIWAIPAFHGPSSRFDPAIFQSVLDRNNLNPAQFLGLMQGQLARTQYFGALRAGIVSPDVLTRIVYRYRGESRTADAVSVTAAAQPAPPAPTQAQLERWYADHPADYRAPEYRRIRAVVLSPQTLASEIKVSEADIAAEFKREAANLATAGSRSVEVVTAPDAAKAKAIAQAWKAGADWSAVQALAHKQGAVAVALTHVARGAFPSPALADAAFAAQQGVVSGPVTLPSGSAVFRVTQITHAVHPTLAAMHDTIRQNLIARRAADLMDARATKLDNLLAGGAALASLPANLGIGAVEGTLDAQAMTPQGKPAPIPGDQALRQAVADAAFRAKPGDPPQLIDGPQTPDGAISGYFALEVRSIIPARQKPFVAVAKQVAADWTQNQLRHAAETIAAQLMTAVNAGSTLSDAAAKAGLAVTRLPAVTRVAAGAGFPPTLLNPLFATKEGKATMAATPDGFVVAQLVSVQDPDPAKHPAAIAGLRQQIAGSIDTDLESLVTQALRERGKPVINQAQLATVASVGP